MKRAVSISIGSSKRNKAVEVTLLGEKVSIERIGTDGDMEAAALKYKELDGKVDAFGVGGADLGALVDGKWFPLYSVQPMVRFVKKTPHGFLSIIYVYPATGKWPRFLPDELQSLRIRHPEGTLTGVNLVSQTLRTITRADAIRASTLGLVLVFGLIWGGFRSFRRACFVFVPFIAGLTCMLGFMATFDLEFNFMNVFVGLMLVGTATDYAVYMLQRYDESPDAFAENALETGRAVVLAALMSIVGFASFAISHYPGVRSIGIASVVGIALSCLASITLLPALLATGRFRHEKASMLGEPPPE